MINNASFNLKAWRKSSKISAAKLAEQIVCDEATIYRYESGVITPNPDIMLSICNALGDPSRWYDWMRVTCNSYNIMHPVRSEKENKSLLREKLDKLIIATTDIMDFLDNS